MSRSNLRNRNFHNTSKTLGKLWAEGSDAMLYPPPTKVGERIKMRDGTVYVAGTRVDPFGGGVTVTGWERS